MAVADRRRPARRGRRIGRQVANGHGGSGSSLAAESSCRSVATRGQHVRSLSRQRIATVARSSAADDRNSVVTIPAHGGIPKQTVGYFHGMPAKQPCREFGCYTVKCKPLVGAGTVAADWTAMRLCAAGQLVLIGYNRLPIRRTQSVASIGMPKWIMRLVPDVPVGTDTVGDRRRPLQAGTRCLRPAPRMQSVQAHCLMRTEAPW